MNPRARRLRRKRRKERVLESYVVRSWRAFQRSGFPRFTLRDYCLGSTDPRVCRWYRGVSPKLRNVEKMRAALRERVDHINRRFAARKARWLGTDMSAEPTTAERQAVRKARREKARRTADTATSAESSANRTGAAEPGPEPGP